MPFFEILKYLNATTILTNTGRNKTIKKKVEDPSEYRSLMTQIIAKLFPNLEWARMDEILESLLIKDEEELSI